MHYQFPIIKHINDVAALRLDPNFDFRQTGPYISVNYRKDAWDAFAPLDGTLLPTLQREARGLKFFADTGDIAARPFHKFFNLNERPETSNLDVHDLDDQIEVVEQKVDGSMIYAQGRVMMTKAGVTDTSLLAARYVDDLPPVFLTLLDTFDGFGVTPIFEFTSPENRVVVAHNKPHMTLLTIRDRITGRYVPRDGLQEMFADKLPGITLATAYNPSLPFEQHRADANEAKEEGVVIVFKNGHRVKVKADWYVAAHKAKDTLSSDDRVISLLFAEHFDDVVASLTELDRRRLVTYREHVLTRIKMVAHETEAHLKRFITMMQGAPLHDVLKELAMYPMEEQHQQQWGFERIRGKSTSFYQWLVDKIIAGKPGARDQVRRIAGDFSCWTP